MNIDKKTLVVLTLKFDPSSYLRYTNTIDQPLKIWHKNTYKPLNQYVNRDRNFEKNPNVVYGLYTESDISLLSYITYLMINNGDL